MNDLNRIQHFHLMTWGDYIKNHQLFLDYVHSLGVRPDIVPANEEVPYATVVCKLSDPQFVVFMDYVAEVTRGER